MKLRTDGHSLRLRIGRSEMEQLQKENRLSTALHLPDEHTFRYSLMISPKLAQPEITFNSGHISIHLPKGEKEKKWLTDENEEGLYYDFLLPSGKFQIRIEKDFPCLHKPGRQKDVFDRPSQKK